MGDNENTTEARLTRVETKLESIEAFLIRLEAKMDARDNQYYTKDIIDEKLSNHQAQIDELKNNKKESRSLWAAWAAVSITAFLGVVSMLPQ